MNTASLRRYAPAARKQFREAVRSRAAKVGLTEGRALSVTVSGDYALLEGSTTPQPRAFADQRRSLEERIRVKGFDGVVEEVAYTWFNRFVAIRYMELHGYLEHGLRMISHPLGGDRLPQALEEATSLDLPGLDRSKVLEMRLDGSRDEELFRMLLLAQCRALHEAMPFLFEPIDDATELLLPDGLLARDSVRGRMVVDVDETDWEPIEVLGWLYQFYISEEKARVDAEVKKGKSVKASEIPAKTQIFTPNWIVKYMVQNSLGRLWYDVEPASNLKSTWDYWIEPAAQEPQVEAELKALVEESRAAHPSPESIRFVDPCAGSGHILVEAYDLFKAMYAERGYGRREIPRLILERNLHGMEIDPRAAQIAGFALLMKARADDRTIVANAPKLHVLALRSFSYAEVSAMNVAGSALYDGDVEAVAAMFENAEVFGSLIRPSPSDMDRVARLRSIIGNRPEDFAGQVFQPLSCMLDQAEALAKHYQVAVTNPPYLDVGKVGEPLKTFAARQYPNSKTDLYGAFIERCTSLAPGGYSALVNIPNWMFLTSFERLRDHLTRRQTIDSLIHPGRGVFGSDFGAVAFVVRDRQLSAYKGSFRRLFKKQGSVSSNEELRSRFFSSKTYLASDEQFRDIPGSPIAYWVGENVRRLFRSGKPLDEFVDARQGLSTGENARFVRLWWEVTFDGIGRECANRDAARASGRRWFPLNKGGEFRRWYGNLEYVVDWENDGQRLLANRPKSVVRNPDRYFQPSVSWSDVTSGTSAFRAYPPGTIFGDVAHSAFADDKVRANLLAYANSPVVTSTIPQISPTVHFHVGYFKRIPAPPGIDLQDELTATMAQELVRIGKLDWDDGEGSMSFVAHPCLRHVAPSLHATLDRWQLEARGRVERTLELETELNRRFIDAAGLGAELDPVSTEATCVWLRPDEELLARTFISYGIGVLMGRWSHEEGVLDDDGILPVTTEAWFEEEDAANRLSKFIGRVWPQEGLRENLSLIASGLGAGEDVPPLDAIRRYLAGDFYGDHLRQYRKRPIYWLFSSGKRRAFGALVYLHRYNAGTLSRMRVDYVVPLQQRMAARLEQLGLDIEASVTTAERRRRTKERDALQGQLDELRDFDERLRHVAGRQIELDLDDGVRANYAKFGDLLAESKAIVRDKDE